MIYSEIDVQFPRHPRALKAGREARDLWYWAHAYVTEQLTDGVVPREWLATYPYDDRAECAAKLVACGLWDLHPDGWLICRYAQKGGQLKADVEARRARDRARKSPNSETKILSARIPNGIPSDSDSAIPDPEERRHAKRQLSLPVPIGAPRLLPRPPQWAQAPPPDLADVLEPQRARKVAQGP